MGYENFEKSNETGENNSPSTEEVNSMLKDMHMTGRAMRINETPEDFKKEREESWDKMQTDQESPVGEIEQENSNVEIADSVENYVDLPNVKLCEKELKSLLESVSDNNDISDKAEILIYKMLTQRSDFVENTYGAGKDIAEYMSEYQPQKEWYRNTRDFLESAISSKENFTWDSNPGWFGINTRPEVGKREGNNVKVYATIPVSEYSFIQNIPELADELRELAIESDDKISVKIPESLSGFMSHNDSIVVHFKNQENTDKIQTAMNKWMSKHDIHESPREMGRTKVATDSAEGSFSQLVAENIANWVQEHAGKYDNEVLSSEAVKHAIRLSQVAPF